MKIRQRKDHIKDLIKKKHNRFKKILQIRYNIYNSDKLFKFKRAKWKYLQLYKLNPFKYRIFSTLEKNSTLPKLKKIINYIPTQRYNYRNLLNTKRLFQQYYSIKRITLIKKYYNQSSTTLIDTTIQNINRFVNVFYYFEKRLDVILQRIFFLPSLYYTQKFILNKNILINKKIISYFNYTLQINDIVEIKKNHQQIASEIFYMLTKKYYKPRFLNILNYFYIEINYNILTFRFHTYFTTINQLHSIFPLKLQYNKLEQYFINKG